MTFFRTGFFVLLMALLFSATSQAKKPPCEIVRAGFDIGSGATKLKVARVDVCRNRLLKILFPLTAQDKKQAVKSVGYKKDLTDSFKDPARVNCTLSKFIQQEGAGVLKNLRALVLKRFPTAAFAGVATSAFRQAKNGKEVIAFLSKAAGIKISIISQQEEAFLGYRAVLARLPGQNPGKLMVWDIGGSSMQMVYRNKQGKLATYLGHLASVPMATWVIEKAQGASRRTKPSPNPVQADDARRGVAYAQKRATRELTKAAPYILQQARGWKVVGIGGVHAFSIQKQAADGQKQYSLADVQQALKLRIAKSDGEVARLNNPLNPQDAMDFVSTEVTNLVLISGFLKAMNLNRVHILSANLSDGLFVSPEYW